MPTYEMIHEARVLLWNYIYSNYVSQQLFSWQWFLIAGLIILAYLIWFKVLDKRRLRELLLLGSFAAVTAAYIDVTGLTMQLWGYKIRLLPISPSLFVEDYTLMPIALMIVHQFSPTWRSYIIGAAAVSALHAFVLLPLFVWADIIALHRWNYLLTFPVTFIAALFVRAAYNWVSGIEQGQSVKEAYTKATIIFQPAMKPHNEEEKKK